MPLNLNVLAESDSDDDHNSSTIIQQSMKKKANLDFISFDDSEDEKDEGNNFQSATTPNQNGTNHISDHHHDDKTTTLNNITIGQTEETSTETNDQLKEENAAEVAQVTKTRDNILSLFSSAQSQWSHHYNIEMAPGQKSDAKPILSSSVKERIAALKNRKKNVSESLASSSIASVLGGVSSSSNDSREQPGAVSPSTLLADQSPTEVLDNDDDDDDVSNNITENNEEESAEGYIKIDDTITNHQFNYEAHNAYAKYQTSIPWQTQSYASYSPPLRLHFELIDFYNFVKQTKEEELVRERVIEKVTKLCKGIDPNCKIQLFGSYPAGLMLPGSDLDLHVISKSNSQKSFLEKLNRELNRSTEFVEINFIRNANVPIVKFKEALSLQEVDVSCNNADTDSSVEFIRKSSEKYPAFKYLCYFLKYFLKQRNSNMVLHGGLSSYGLSLMIISHLQMHTSNSSIEERDVTSLGTLLIDFFALYGRYFNYYFTAISPSGEGKYLPYVMKIRSGYSSSLKFSPNIIDPTNAHNNVSKGTSGLLSIRNSFSNAFDALMSPTNINKESLLSTILRVSPDLCWRRIYIHQDRSFINTCKQFAGYFTQYFGDEEEEKKSKKKRSFTNGGFNQKKKKKF
ncbi:hypothetical protein C9374_009607 [Naegleria lovaniensis]|uniref:Polynucleotide adenylyltransferase n=1 Tax=Naegleria lovaniensis TaxID=51637 RepID=A0AA88H1E5_NAELO|nr:uncharacterized protein C9374_009607 [Naegleria lovaniensis]KAG2393030.1 hypothetical protein C9374_009607 [Naegleria lovaniensis]